MIVVRKIKFTFVIDDSITVIGNGINNGMGKGSANDSINRIGTGSSNCYNDGLGNFSGNCINMVRKF